MRYAIYLAPGADTSLWNFGCRVLGRDAERGAEVPALAPDRIDPELWRQWTQAPRRYGFHGTLKAPFALAADRDEAGLLAAVGAFAAAYTGFVMPPLKVAALGPFVALVPHEESQDLIHLAGASVETFESFRAPLTSEALARRLSVPLTDRQRQHVERWGYPYVFADFRFHMTLTGSLPQDEVARVTEGLAALYAREVGKEPAQASLALFVEPHPHAPFQLLRRFALR
jgi:putative phosphonate metabolism protein